MHAIVVRSCFCLVRLVPLLEVLRSPLVAPVEDVARRRLSGGQAADESLIALSDYCDALRQGPGCDHVRMFEFRIAFASLIVSGVGDPRWGAAEDGGVRVNARGLWRTVDADLGQARGFKGAPVGVGEFERREIAWQEREQSVFSSMRVLPVTVSSHRALLDSARDSSREDLAGVGVECGWRPMGPCGPRCDRPECAARPAACIERRRWQQQTLGARLRRKHGALTEKWYLELLYFEESSAGVREELIEVGEDGYERRKIITFGH